MKNKITWKTLSFEQLSTTQLYDILHLRNKVFAVEQNDVYLDVDNQDQQAWHMMGFVGNKLVAYCRVFLPKDDEAKIGRVVVDVDFRKYGLGRLLMTEALAFIHDEIANPKIMISAQLYLQRFYESFGFVTQGESYLDGSIAHIDMERSESL